MQEVLGQALSAQALLVPEASQPSSLSVFWFFFFFFFCASLAVYLRLALTLRS
jgi:hypothetical protein